MKSILLAISLPFLMIPRSPKESYLIVGTYTGGKSEGIYVFKFNPADGSTTPVSSIKTSNPSYLAISPDQRFVYAVQEDAKDGKGGDISAYSFDQKTGTLTLINHQPTGGDHPCYVEIDHTGKWVFAGNYSGGNISVFPVNPDGSLGKAELIQHTGSSVNKDRQEKPHVHCTKISPDNKHLYVPDLGIDKVMIYDFNALTGKLTSFSQPYVSAEPGSGPRHITFHPNGKKAYLIEELTGTVVVYDHKNGQLTEVQKISSTAAGEKGFAGSADIHVSPDGKFLYASNRGDFNNIAIYKIHPKTGKLSSIGFQSTLGKNPRNFNFDPTGQYLLVGNQSSDEIVVFKKDKKKGLLTDSGQRISVGKPVCIKWITP